MSLELTLIPANIADENSHFNFYPSEKINQVTAQTLDNCQLVSDLNCFF